MDYVIEMCDWIQKESKTERQIVNLCNKFMKSFEFLKQESFNTRGFPFFEGQETPRAFVILLRLLKQKQMFSLLTEERQDDPLRGRNVVRFRDKRLSVYSKEVYKFLEFVYNLIQNGDVDVRSMYICRDHKTLTKKNDKGENERSIQGLLWYIVFPDDVNAEKFLKRCVKKCGENFHFEQMFRKQASKKKNATRQYQQKRDALDGKWTEKEFKKQQEMYHFGLALAGGEFKSKPEAHLIDHNLQNNRLNGC